MVKVIWDGGSGKEGEHNSSGEEILVEWRCRDEHMCRVCPLTTPATKGEWI